MNPNSHGVKYGGKGIKIANVSLRQQHMTYNKQKKQQLLEKLQKRRVSLY